MVIKIVTGIHNDSNWDSDTLGMADMNRKEIWIKPGLNQRVRKKVIAHEKAHFAQYAKHCAQCKKLHLSRDETTDNWNMRHQEMESKIPRHLQPKKEDRPQRIRIKTSQGRIKTSQGRKFKNINLKLRFFKNG